MACLSDLPTELVLQIIEALEGDNATLFNLSLVSRQFAENTRGIFYRSITLPGKANGQLPLLVDKLLRNWPLAEKVQRLKLDVYAFALSTVHSSGGQDRVEPIDAFDKRNQDGLADFTHRALSYIRSAGNTQEANDTNDPLYHWEFGLKRGRQTDLAGLLLAMLPNLEYLDFRIFWCAPTLLLMPGASRLFGSTQIFNFAPIRKALCQIFSKIKRLKINAQQFGILELPFRSLETLDIDCFEPGFDIRNLPEGRKDWFRPDHNEWERITVIPQPSLRTLLVNIHSCELDDRSPEFFWPILFIDLQAASLTSISVTVIATARPDDERDLLGRFSVLTNALDRVAPNLESLTIDFSSDPQYFHAWCAERLVSKISLKPFAQLRHIKLAEHALIDRAYGDPGYDGRGRDISIVLPPMLETLTITCSGPKTVTWLYDLYQIHSVFPRLRSIQLICRPYVGMAQQWLEDNLRDLIRTFSEVGVQITTENDKQSFYLARPDRVFVKHELIWQRKEIVSWSDLVAQAELVNHVDDADVDALLAQTDAS